MAVSFLKKYTLTETRHADGCVTADAVAVKQKDGT
jgi:hypothetical protein